MSDNMDGGSNNEVTQESGPRSISPGETIGFDEIMDLDSIPKMERAEAKDETEKSEPKAAKKEPKAAEAKEKEDDKDDQKNSREQDKEEKKEGELDKELELDVKKLKAKYNDSELEIPEEALFEIPVNGKLEPVTLKDLKNEYSGRTAWDRKFTELDKKEKSFDANMKSVNGQINSFVEMVEKDKPMEAMAHMAEIVGLDPYKFVKGLRDKLLPQMQKYAQMTPDERTAFDKSEENEFLRQRLQSDDSRKQAEQAEKDLEGYFSKVMSEHNVTGEELESAHKALVGSGADESSEGYHEKVVEYALTGRRVDTVLEAIKTVDPKLMDDNALIVEMVNTLKSEPDFTKEDIIDVIKSVYGSSINNPNASEDDGKAKKLKKAAAATGTTIDKKQGESGQSQDPNNKHLSFDDL